MSWIDWLCIGIVVLGFILFLYGANYFNAIIGWVGVSLFVAGIVARLFIYLNKELHKK